MIANQTQQTQVCNVVHARDPNFTHVHDERIAHSCVAVRPKQVEEVVHDNFSVWEDVAAR